MGFDKAALKAELERDEGRRGKPYQDSVGVWTVGVGHNLTARGLSDPEIDMILDNDIAEAEIDLTANLPWWRTLDDVRQRVMLNMCFNMGIKTLMGFTITLAAIQAHRWKDAADGMRTSLWAKQVGARAERLAVLMETAPDPQAYAMAQAKAMQNVPAYPATLPPSPALMVSQPLPQAPAGLLGVLKKWWS